VIPRLEGMLVLRVQAKAEGRGSRLGPCENGELSYSQNPGWAPSVEAGSISYIGKEASDVGAG
jgi:hypothetical protein